MILLLIVTLYYYIAYIISLKLFLLIYICYTRLWVWIPLGVRSTTLCDKVCQLLITGLWFSPVSSTNKTDCHDITEILLKVALNTIKLNQNQTKSVKLEFLMWFREGGVHNRSPFIPKYWQWRTVIFHNLWTYWFINSKKKWQHCSWEFLKRWKGECEVNRSHKFPIQCCEPQFKSSLLKKFYVKHHDLFILMECQLFY
jgi:hypothetical protein